MESVKRSLALQLLTAAVDAAGKGGKASVAKHLGYGRALISRVLSPNDPLDISAPLIDRVIERYHVIPLCPATGQAQPVAECYRLNAGKAPMHNPAAMQVWKKCQTCAHKPKEGEAK